MGLFNKKYKIRLLDEEWREIMIYESTALPNENDLLTIDSEYYVIMRVIHNIDNDKFKHLIIRKYN